MENCSCVPLLARLKACVAARGLDAFVVSNADPHDSEEPPRAYLRVRKVSGFTGSNGTCVVTTGAKHYLLTDSRYTAQAERQLCSAHWVTHNQRDRSLALVLQEAQLARVGFDATVTPFRLYQKTVAALPAEYVFTPCCATAGSNPVDEAAGNEAPARVTDSVRFLSAEESGCSVEQKLTQFRARRALKPAEAYLVSNLDDIAWLLNVRGNSIEHAPVVTSFLLLSARSAVWFLPRETEQTVRCESGLRELQNQSALRVAEYDAVVSTLKELQRAEGLTAVVTTNNVSTHLKLAIEALGLPVQLESASELGALKAKKNSTEVAQMTRFHKADGLVLTLLIFYLKHNEALLARGDYSEADVVRDLEELKRVVVGHDNAAFSSIVGCNENSAIIHYNPLDCAAAPVQDNSILLIDQGSHYGLCTTDTTRTICLGRPLREWVATYTRVLAAHIDLADVVFPARKVRGSQLDVLCRRHFWRHCADFAHGTGHGVGAGLCVHEAPPNICYLSGKSCADVEFEENMIVSNEPGSYNEGFGVRIENMQIAEPVAASAAENATQYLRFRQLTCVPYEKELIDFAQLDKAQLQYLVAYNRSVRQSLASCLREYYSSFKNGSRQFCGTFSSTRLRDFFENPEHFNPSRFFEWLDALTSVPGFVPENTSGTFSE